MSGQIPGRKRPAGPAEDQTTKKARLVAPTQQTQVPVPGPEEELTGDISDDPADKTVVLKAGPGTSDPSASTTAMVPDPVLVSTTTATSATDLATPFLMLLPPQWGAADAEIKVPSGENTELKRSPFQAWSRSVYSHTCCAYCQGFLPCLFLPFQSIHLHFFQNLSQFFPVLACGIK